MCMCDRQRGYDVYGSRETKTETETDVDSESDMHKSKKESQKKTRDDKQVCTTYNSSLTDHQVIIDIGRRKS